MKQAIDQALKPISRAISCMPVWWLTTEELELRVLIVIAVSAGWFVFDIAPRTETLESILKNIDLCINQRTETKFHFYRASVLVRHVGYKPCIYGSTSHFLSQHNLSKHLFSKITIICCFQVLEFVPLNLLLPSNKIWARLTIFKGLNTPNQFEWRLPLSGYCRSTFDNPTVVPHTERSTTILFL